MDLLVVKLPRGLTLRVGSGAEWWSCEDVVAVFPRAGHLADNVLNAFAHDDNLTIRAPLAAVLAAVAQGLAANDYGGEESELEASGDSCSCTFCEREREGSPPPPPLPADPSAQRLTEDALARHTEATNRDRSRSRSPRGDRRCCIHCGRFEDESDEYGPYGTTCPDCLRAGRFCQ
jgi:hypothetical protein